jgi:septum site-determining protein MinC
MADGNIHVYGPLRGRALAGMKGNTDARIFCQDLAAELVSVAGHYRVSENIPDDLRGVPVQVYLDQKILRIERL